MDATQFVSMQVPVFMATFGLSLILIAVAMIIICGLALWKAAKLNDHVWFWIILVVNTAGILPLIYLIIRRNRKV